MMSKMHLDRTKQMQQMDENELDQFNHYLQKDIQQHLPQNLTTSLSYSKIKINMPVIAEQQNETPGHTRQSTVQVSKTQRQSQKPQQIKLSLRIIFKFYASFGNRHNTKYLKSNKFIKLLCDSNIVPKLISNRDADMLYSQETKNLESLTLEQFQNFLPKLAMLIYQNLSVQQAFVKLYETHFDQLSQKIIQFTDFGQQIQFVLQPIPQELNEFIKPIIPQLHQLHQFIFEEQSKKESKVQWQFIQFLIQCELIPNYINQSQAQLIFDNIGIREPTIIVQDPQYQQGHYLFQFVPFVESLILISKSIPELDDFSKFRIILDKIEQSEGFNKFLKKLNRTQSDRVKLFYNIEKSRLSNSMNKSNIQVDKIKSETSMSRINQSGLKQSTFLMDYPSNANVKRLFEHYAQMGEPSNVQSLKNTKFNKLLMNAQILNQYISVTECDMIYAKLTGNSFVKEQMNNNQLYNKKMTYTQFQIALKIIAEKANVTVEQLIDQHLVPLEKQISDENKDFILQILVDMLQDEQIVHLYESIQPIFNQYFAEFAKQTSEIMFLSEFLRFAMDFELANILISQTQLTQIFYAVASLNQDNQFQDLICIDKSQFVEAVSIIAIIVYQTVEQPIQRIAYLLEKIYQSQNGAKLLIKQNKLQNRFQQVLEELQSKFNGQSDKKQQESEKIDFNELLNYYSNIQ